MNDEIRKFILLIEVHFPRPKFTGDEAKEALWLRSMTEILSDYEPDVLAEAALTIIRTRDPDKANTMFPKPVECIRACDAARNRRRVETLLALSGDDPRRIEPPRSLSEFRIERGSVSWDYWLAHLESIGRKDVAQAADAAGLLTASSRWPRPESVVFQPPETGQYNYSFARLQQM